MSKTIILFFLTSVFFACGQAHVNTDNSEQIKTYPRKYEARRDSVLEQTNDGSVYFTRDTTAKSYTYLNPKEIDSSIFQTIMPSMIESIFVEHKSKIKHVDHDLINSTWTSLYWFNNEFCLYSPSDWMNNTHVLITDSTFYFLSSADPMLELITHFKQLNATKYEFKSIDYFGGIRTTTIDIINSEKGIAIWEYKSANKEQVVKELKVRSENVKLFPMIICDCGDTKCIFERTDFFDTPNFGELKKSYESVLKSTKVIKVTIDTSLCIGNSYIDGEFGLYGITRSAQQRDTLLIPLQFIESQEIVLENDNYTNFRLVYSPSDATVPKAVFPIDDFNSKANTIQLDCFFFRKPLSLLDKLQNKDTLYITTEYRGISHAGMIFPRSTLRIIKKKNQFYYSRNNLPTDGDLVFLTFPGGKYENGFSEDKILTEEQLESIRQFEMEIVNPVENSRLQSNYELSVTLKGRTYKFHPNLSSRNEKAHPIWEKLK
jgi:hypothetical protein